MRLSEKWVSERDGIVYRGIVYRVDPRTNE